MCYINIIAGVFVLMGEKIGEKKGVIIVLIFYHYKNFSILACTVSVVIIAIL